MKKIFVAIALMFVIVSSDVAAAKQKQWLQFTQCRYVETKYNDGDSFRVNCDGREFVLRLYYVDAPETDLSNGVRVGEQRAYFGVTIEDILATGEKATERVRKILQEPLAVSTRWAVAGGRSAEPRFYGLVAVGEKRLIEVLLAEGLARTKGIVANLPTGEKSKMYLDRLRDIERHAKDQKRAHGRIQRNSILSETKMMPNPAVKRDCAKARSPLASLRWAA